MVPPPVVPSQDEPPAPGTASRKRRLSGGLKAPGEGDSLDTGADRPPVLGEDMTTTPDEPAGGLSDDDMTTTGSSAEPLPGDADGTDGNATDTVDGDASDSDGTDSGGTDSDGTDTVDGGAPDGGDADGTDGTDGSAL